MLEERQKTFVLTPFVVAYPEAVEAKQSQTATPRKPGSHLSKDEATREVLQRIVQRVKKI